MDFPYMFARETCPPVLRVYCETELTERRTLLRAPGETDALFCLRAQRVAYRRWLASACKASCRIECIYEMPSPEEDAFFFDDERWMDISTLRGVLNSPNEPAEVRVACAKALNRIHGLVSADVW